MTIRNFDDPVLFQKSTQAFLLENEAENVLPLGILNNITSGDYREREPYLAFVEEEEKPALIALCTPPHPVLISYQKQLIFVFTPFFYSARPFFCIVLVVA